jgi:hypothetical protein
VASGRLVLIRRRAHHKYQPPLARIFVSLKRETDAHAALGHPTIGLSPDAYIRLRRAGSEKRCDEQRHEYTHEQPPGGEMLMPPECMGQG